MRFEVLLFGLVRCLTAVHAFSQYHQYVNFTIVNESCMKLYVTGKLVTGRWWDGHDNQTMTDPDQLLLPLFVSTKIADEGDNAKKKVVQGQLDIFDSSNPVDLILKLRVYFLSALGGSKLVSAVQHSPTTFEMTNKTTKFALGDVFITFRRPAVYEIKQN
jgi:hypothetical protein